MTKRVTTDKTASRVAKKRAANRRAIWVAPGRLVPAVALDFNETVARLLKINLPNKNSNPLQAR